MSKFKGTKGKWGLTDKKRGIEVNVKPCVYKSICKATGNTKWQYDMLLISKAPELLGMLEDITDCFSEDDLKNCVASFAAKILKAKQLIKEATEL
jgi:hypothetical protein